MSILCRGINTSLTGLIHAFTGGFALLPTPRASNPGLIDLVPPNKPVPQGDRNTLITVLYALA